MADIKAYFARPEEILLSSYTTWPAFVTQTQLLTGPLPLPIRTERGFLVRGLYGKTLTHKKPVFLSILLIALRPASICENVNALQEELFKAKLPKVILNGTLFLFEFIFGL